MKKLFLLLAFVLFTFNAGAQAPTKLLDVRNGNGIVDSGVAQPQAIYTAFKDAPAKQEWIDAECELGNWAALDPATRPGKQAFALRELQTYMRNRIRQARQNAIERNKATVNESDLPQ